ncbi:MAG: delta-lactam-biosynthetic de-N-acetylase [Deltaproteobacteria bacterium]
MKKLVKIAILMLSFTLMLCGCQNKQNSYTEQTTQNITVSNPQEKNTNNIPESTTPKANSTEMHKEIIKTNDTSSSSEAVPTLKTGSNKRLSWSFVRKKDNLPPAFTKQYSELADKYGAIYIGDTTKKTIYLTFDEGYENGYTPKILDALKDNNIKAAFFITMPFLKNNSDLVERMLNEGHIVGNHTVHHPSLPEVSDQKVESELVDLDLYFKEKTGISMKYMRAPKGEFSERTLKISKDLGYTNVFWSFAYADWDIKKQKGADNAYNMVMNNIHNGAVLLLHAVSSDNAEAMDRIIKELKAQGYIFGTLDEFNK